MTIEIFVTCPECCGEGATEHPPRRQFFDDPYYMEVDCCTACNGVGGWIEEFDAKRDAIEMEELA